MAKIGLAAPCWAPINVESTTALPTYTAGFALGKAVKADLTIEYAEGKMYADNQLVEDVSEFASGSISLETDNLTLANMGTIYGAAIVDDELGNGADDTPPFGGFAYYQILQVAGVKKYRAFFYPKVKAKMGDETASTKANSFELGATPVTLTVYKPSFGKWRYVKEFTTEAAALAYVQAKLSVAVWHAIDVLVTGAGAGESATPEGVTMVAAAGSFALTIAGTCTALYDNGTESKASIAAGVYTVANVAAAHKIAVIF